MPLAMAESLKATACWNAGIFEHGTPLADAWDDLLDYQDARGRLVECSQPVYAGTIVSPMGCDVKLKFDIDERGEITSTKKYRPGLSNSPQFETYCGSNQGPCGKVHFINTIAGILPGNRKQGRVLPR